MAPPALRVDLIAASIFQRAVAPRLGQMLDSEAAMLAVGAFDAAAAFMREHAHRTETGARRYEGLPQQADEPAESAPDTRPVLAARCTHDVVIWDHCIECENAHRFATGRRP